MHTIEPFYKWRSLYISEKDEKSPFFGKNYNNFELINTVYNYYIHPQWDEFGSETLYLKILFVDYNIGYTIIELIGEWNDTLYNDVMFFKREVIDVFLNNGIERYIIIGENVLNFHASDDSYYEEWFSDIENGWIVGINFREHVVQEFLDENIDHYINFGNFNWRVFLPYKLFTLVDDSVRKKIAN